MDDKKKRTTFHITIIDTNNSEVVFNGEVDSFACGLHQVGDKPGVMSSTVYNDGDIKTAMAVYLNLFDLQKQIEQDFEENHLSELLKLLKAAKNEI